MALPLVDVLVITWNRPETIVKTWAALKERLRYPSLRWVVADDHSPEEVFAFIHDQLQPDIIFRTKKRSGWGANVNNALRQLDSEFVFQIEDDYVLSNTHIDLVPAVDILTRYPEFGMVRYGGLTGHDLTCRLRELKAMPCAASTEQTPHYHVWEILKKESRFLHVYSHQPHLKHKRFHEAYGLYPEGLKLGATEESFAHRVKNMVDGPGIICFPEFVTNYFDHIGKSWQHTEYDIFLSSKGSQA